MNAIEIYIDESGDFGPFDERCPYYIVTMVFHETVDALYGSIQELEYRLSMLGLENHCIHSSPAIRGEGEYRGMDMVLRRKMLSCFAAFIRSSGLKFKCFFIHKQPGADETGIVAALHGVLDPFLTAHYRRLSGYSLIQVAYDKGQQLLSQLITDTFLAWFTNVRLTKVLPIHSRLFQVADFFCTLRRMAFRLAATGSLAKSELRFFGSVAKFQRNWLRPFFQSEWR